MTKGKIRMIASDGVTSDKIRPDIIGECPIGEVTIHLPSLHGYADPSPSFVVENVSSNAETAVATTYSSTSTAPPGGGTPPTTNPPNTNKDYIDKTIKVAPSFPSGTFISRPSTSSTPISSQVRVHISEDFLCDCTFEKDIEDPDHSALYGLVLREIFESGMTGEDLEYNTILGAGEYPDLSNECQFLICSAIAVDKGTRMKLYSDINYGGRMLLDIEGPFVLYSGLNNMFVSDLTRSATVENWVEPHNSYFPRDSRMFIDASGADRYEIDMLPHFLSMKVTKA